MIDLGKNTMEFILRDNTNKNKYNESCHMTKSWYSDPEEIEIMSIEEYYVMCRQFAASMGYAEKTIDEWFGEY